MKVHFVTHGCKANQYDTEKFRQELEARGAVAVDDPHDAEAAVVNTCTVTNNADRQARKAIRKLKR
ncbi:MAG: tRNA (N(6)-L-threonylcarbamoyladenosine(37)-C(2))-methylthiotransferase MtaB, partial [Myxococcota bacterium]